MNSSLMPITLGIVFCFGTAMAADLPKQGTDSYTTTYVIVSSDQMKAGDRTVTTYESVGITRNDNGGPMFNDMGARCVGMSDVVGKDAASRAHLCRDR